MLVDSHLELKSARLFVYDVARRADSGEDVRFDSAGAKILAVEAGTRVCDRAIQIHGGGGLMNSRTSLLFIVGLTVFTLASALCASAPNATVLIIGRLLQGAASGTQMPQVMGLIQQFSGAGAWPRSRSLRCTYGCVDRSGAGHRRHPGRGGGPVKGWRWIFWMNLPLGVIAIALAI